jgi:hypothetical protein
VLYPSVAANRSAATPAFILHLSKACGRMPVWFAMCCVRAWAGMPGWMHLLLEGGQARAVAAQAGRWHLGLHQYLRQAEKTCHSSRGRLSAAGPPVLLVA